MCDTDHAFDKKLFEHGQNTQRLISAADDTTRKKFNIIYVFFDVLLVGIYILEINYFGV